MELILKGKKIEEKISTLIQLEDKYNLLLDKQKTISYLKMVRDIVSAIHKRDGFFLEYKSITFLYHSDSIETDMFSHSNNQILLIPLDKLSDETKKIYYFYKNNTNQQNQLELEITIAKYELQECIANKYGIEVTRYEFTKFLPDSYWIDLRAKKIMNYKDNQ